jgi:hypothetical protein
MKRTTRRALILGAAATPLSAAAMEQPIARPRPALTPGFPAEPTRAPVRAN